ncbi:hypothetical protein Plhal710r2_c038g0135221 [Plasmopara halstedii]
MTQFTYYGIKARRLTPLTTPSIRPNAIFEGNQLLVEAHCLRDPVNLFRYKTQSVQSHKRQRLNGILLSLKPFRISNLTEAPILNELRESTVPLFFMGLDHPLVN